MSALPRLFGSKCSPLSLGVVGQLRESRDPAKRRRSWTRWWLAKRKSWEERDERVFDTRVGSVGISTGRFPGGCYRGSLALVGELRCGEINILFVHTLQLAEGWLMVNVEENFRFPVVLVASSLPHRPDRRMARWKSF